MGVLLEIAVVWGLMVFIALLHVVPNLNRIREDVAVIRRVLAPEAKPDDAE